MASERRYSVGDWKTAAGLQSMAHLDLANSASTTTDVRQKRAFNFHKIEQARDKRVADAKNTPNGSDADQTKENQVQRQPVTVPYTALPSLQDKPKPTVPVKTMKPKVQANQQTPSNTPKSGNASLLSLKAHQAAMAAAQVRLSNKPVQQGPYQKEATHLVVETAGH